MITQDLFKTANKMRIYSIEAHQNEILQNETLFQQIKTLIEWEKEEREQRKLRLYLQKSNLSSFEMLDKYDWNWPSSIDREQIMDLFTLDFVSKGTNVAFISAPGLGKTMLTQNLVHLAARRGVRAMFVESSSLLDELNGEKLEQGLEKALKKYMTPDLLAIDEIGYLSYSSHHADLLFQLVHRRCRDKKSIIITTNRSFKDWGEVFPNAACVTALIDRFVQRCEIIKIEGSSWRASEFEANQKEKASRRKRNS